MKCEIYNDHFENAKTYNIPKAQLIIADIPYNLGNNAYASNPQWYKDDHNTKAEIVTLEEKSIAHYFSTLKVAAIEDYKEGFQKIMDTLDDLSCSLDSKIGECDRIIKQEKDDE